MVPILPVVGVVTNHHLVVRLARTSKIRFENLLKLTFKQIQFPRSAHRSARRYIHNFEALFVHLVQLVDDVLLKYLPLPVSIFSPLSSNVSVFPLMVFSTMWL